MSYQFFLVRHATGWVLCYFWVYDVRKINELCNNPRIGWLVKGKIKIIWPFFFGKYNLTILKYYYKKNMYVGADISI